MKKTYLITGGAGFIASSLAQHLLKNQNTVVCLDNFDAFYDRSIKENNIKDLFDYTDFKFIEGDIRDKVLLHKIFEENTIDLVFHLAAKAGVRPSILQPQEYYDVNVSGTLQLLEAMKHYKINKLIFASSSSVYGNNSSGPSSETENVEFPISPYAATKRSGELLLHTFHHLYGVNVVNLRLFTVFGPKQRPDLAIHKFFKRIYKQEAIEVYGDGSTKRDYTYIDDVIHGFVLSAKHLFEKSIVYETVNIGNNKPVTLNELINLLEEVTQKKVIKKHFTTQQGDVNSTCANIQKAQKLLNYYPSTTMKEGLIQFKNWYEKTL